MEIQKTERNLGIFGFLNPLRFGIKFMTGKKWLLWLIMGVSAVSIVTRLLVPIYIGDSVTEVELKNLSLAEHFAILIVVVSVISGVTRFIMNYSSQYLSQQYGYNLRKDLVKHILRKKFSFYERQASGDLLSRLTMDIQASINFILNTLSQLIPTLMLIAVALYLLFTLNHVYAIFFLAAVPLIVYLGIVFQKKQRVHWRNIRSDYGRMNEELQENIVGQRVIRGFSAEDQEVGKFTGTTDSYYEEYMDVAQLRGFYNNIMPFVISGAATAVLLYGGYVDLIGARIVGSLVSAINIFTMISMPVGFLGRLIVWSENASAGIERISEVLDPSEEEEVSSGNRIPSGSTLTFSDVSFRRGNRYILRDITFSVRRGEVLGVTGRTAAGKSTMVGLIPRFYEPSSGSITIEGRDITDIRLDELRKKVALVPQEINILSGTVTENIVFGRENLGMERVKWSSRVAQISDFIESLPQGYDSMVGERGITVSGGQKQRIGVARALYGRPEILILDDATSSVDPETELNMLRTIKKELQDISIILVSHRESALRFCDRVIRLENGSLVNEEPLAESEGEDLVIDEEKEVRKAADLRRD